MKTLRTLIISFYILLFFFGCKNDVANSTTMNIQISELGLNQPFSKYEVCLYEVKKPFYSMWQFHKINCAVLDNNGPIIFNVKKNGHYRIDIDGSNGFYYMNDFIKVKDFEKIKLFDFIYSEENVEVRLSFNKKID